jgi:phosphatidylglycerophosphatase A
MKTVIKLLNTFFYTGYFPCCPGTIGSLAGLGFYYLVKDNFLYYSAFTLFFLFCGFLLAGQAEKLFGERDSQRIVIDEACGMLLSLYLIPYSLKTVIIGFILFRIFDILKPPPLKRLQNLKGSAGIMLDDIGDAVYTNLILRLILKIFP